MYKAVADEIGADRVGIRLSPFYVMVSTLRMPLVRQLSAMHGMRCSISGLQAVLCGDVVVVDARLTPGTMQSGGTAHQQQFVALLQEARTGGYPLAEVPGVFCNTLLPWAVLCAWQRTEEPCA